MNIIALRKPAAALSLLAGVVALQATATHIWANAAPVIDDPLMEGVVAKVEAKVPVGKALVLPLTATDADGDPLTYKVTSSNPKIMVRARTGHPHLKVAVTHEAADGTDIEIDGVLEFALFREWAPKATGFISGFAQSQFYRPKTTGETQQHIIFHRVIKDFMAQTGDPNGHTRNQRDANNQLIAHGPGFSFNSEVQPHLLFTGRGQLAMANAGFDNLYNGTNGSQWFATAGPQRHLDFNHTIFGQLVRGFPVLEQINNVKTTDQPPRTDLGNGQTDSAEVGSWPVKPIKITSTSVGPNFTDAVLVIAANGLGQSTITVEVTDPAGLRAAKSFQVEAIADTHNSPPFFVEAPVGGVIPKDRAPIFPLRALDLEKDYLFTQSQVLSGKQAFNRTGNGLLQVYPVDRTNAPLDGKTVIGATVTQFEQTGIDRGTDDQVGMTFGIGAKPLATKGLTVFGTPGTPQALKVATFTNANLRALGTEVLASINWGDGTDVTTVIPARDTATPAISAYQVAASHNYALPGVYSVQVTLTSNSGILEIIRGTAVISSKPLKAGGEQLEVKGKKITNQVLAIMRDSEPGIPADYEALVDWGDGVVTPGQVKRAGDGQFFITGQHTYNDPATYSLTVQVKRRDAEPAEAAVGWATLTVSGFSGQEHLPPFSMARIISDITPLVKKDVPLPLLTTAGNAIQQTTITCGVVVISHGDKKVPASNIRFYLSADRTLNLEDETYLDSSVDPPVMRTNPKDVPLTVGPKKKQMKIIALKPGIGGQINFERAGGDSRLYLPKNEPGLGYYLLAHFDYKEPMVDAMKVDRIAVEDLGTPIEVSGPDPARQNRPGPTLELDEVEGSPKHIRTFKIKLARRPSSPVTIPLSILHEFGFKDGSEIFFTAKPPNPEQFLTDSPDHAVTFTPEQWDQGEKEQTVSLTSKQDNVADGEQIMIVTVGPAVSMDARLHGRSGPPLRVYNRDRDSVITVSPQTLTTSEAAGADREKTFEVTLVGNPANNGNVTFEIKSEDLTEGRISLPNSMNEAEKVPQEKLTVTLNAQSRKVVVKVTAQDDDIHEPVAPQYFITLGLTNCTQDPLYHGVNPPDVTVTNLDNDPAPAANGTENDDLHSAP